MALSDNLTRLMALPLNYTVDFDLVRRMDFNCLPFSEVAEEVSTQDGHSVSFAPVGWLDKDARNTKRDRLATSNFLAAETMRRLRRASKADAKKVRRHKDLSRLTQLPPELVYEILEFLHPLDLIHLSATSRSLRNLLVGDDIQAIWKTSILRLEGLFKTPACPPNVSYYDWAHLIFGAPRCSECGAHFAYPDFHLHKRLCTSCMGRMLMQVPEEVDFLVIGTNRTAGNQIEGYSSESFSWPVEVLAMMEKVAVLQTGIATGVAGAAEAHEELLMTQNAIVVQKEEYVKQCVDWMKSIRDRFTSDRWSYVNAFVDRITARFLRLNHDKDDVEYACRCLRAYERRGNRRNFRFSKRAFEEIRPGVELNIEENKQRRLWHIRLLLVNGRQADVLKGIRQAKCRLAKPVDWAYWPEASDMARWPELDAIINDPSDTRLELAEVEAVIETMVVQGVIEKWKREQVEHLLTLLPITTAEPGDLEFATCIFSAPRWDGPTVFFGRSEVTRGQYLSNISSISFSSRGRDAAVSLLELVHVDHKTTRMKDVDPTLRFICLHCAKKRNGKARALTWKDAVVHFVDSDNEIHRTPAWHWLSVECTHYLRQREKPEVRASDDCWSCNLCSDHYDNYVTKREVSTHLWTKHQIHRDHAVQDEDYVLVIKPRDSEPSFRLTVDINALYRCPHCPLSPQGKDDRRVFRHRDFKQHLRDKHADVASFNESEWVQKPVVRASTLVEEEDTPATVPEGDQVPNTVGVEQATARAPSRATSTDAS